MKSILLLTAILTINSVKGQDQKNKEPLDNKLPYSEIPANPENYTAGNVASRLIDGLGFRFYWATAGLRDEDLTYKPDKDTRSTIETIEHIYEMSVMIRNAATETINTSDQSPRLPFNEMRKKTLENFKLASNILKKSSDDDLTKYTLKFKQGEILIEYPFWNHINGPISDCLWHTGQIVSFRRLSGNPFSEKVNLLSGTIIK
ncbi:MAG: hypothetical protein LW821_05825 [Flammeovirgaceae bacterium]|jgi:hypothetical protein|nr:hypothetical protein [Flammeovirgaceae bacterium]